MTDESVYRFYEAARRIGGERGLEMPMEDALVAPDLPAARSALVGLRQLADSKEGEAIPDVMRSTAMTARDIAVHALLCSAPAQRDVEQLWAAIRTPIPRCSSAVVVAWLCDPDFETRGLAALHDLVRAEIPRAVRDELGATLSEFIFESIERRLNRAWLTVVPNTDGLIPLSIGERALVGLNRLYWRLEELGELDALAVRKKGA